MRRYVPKCCSKLEACMRQWRYGVTATTYSLYLHLLGVDKMHFQEFVMRQQYFREIALYKPVSFQRAVRSSNLLAFSKSAFSCFFPANPG